ncbi:histidine kinase [Streptomyces sp. NPDC002004]
MRRDAPFELAGAAVQFVAVAIPLSVPWILFPQIAALWAVVVATLAPAVVPAALCRQLTAVQRHRFKALSDLDIQGPARRWHPLAYHLLAGPAVALGQFVAVCTVLLALPAATAYLWIWALPPSARLALPVYTQAEYLTAYGVVLTALGAWSLDALARLDRRAALAFLTPDPALALERRVENLTESRAGVVDAADAERRRIERDLHDGAQQRLVSMAMNLGLAKATLPDIPDDARKVIEEAHREAKEAIEELSSLVRGLHPAVLDDRGLDAALSGIAARAPLPVRLHVDLTQRAAPAVEAVAYFVVSEALANVAKHARATRADVDVVRVPRPDGDVLRLVVTDDGVGGADPSRGSGLAGLTRRAASVDGTFRFSSPRGGPTVLTVELPCQQSSAP